MVKLGKLTDYGLVLLTCMAHGNKVTLHTARDLALESEVPLPTVSKILKELLRKGLLTSHRGNKGGYFLARPPKDISVAEVIAALEGPVAFTECSPGEFGLCDLEPRCPIKSNQRIISQAIHGVLEKITIADLIQPLQLNVIKDLQGKLVPTIQSIPWRSQ